MFCENNKKVKSKKESNDNQKDLKQWMSNKPATISLKTKDKPLHSSSVQNKQLKSKDNKTDVVDPNHVNLRVSWVLRVRQEMGIKHSQTYSFLKKWFGKIFINGSNSQQKFYEAFKSYLLLEEHVFFLCFGQAKSGKTFSIQGKTENP